MTANIWIRTFSTFEKNGFVEINERLTKKVSKVHVSYCYNIQVKHHLEIW